MHADFVRRVRIIASAITLIALVLVARLYTLQIMHGAEYRDKAEVQYGRSSAALGRGTIFFTDKNGLRVSAATLASGYTLAVVPRQIEDAEGAYRQVNALFPIDHDAFITKAAKPDDPYEVIATRVPIEAGDAIESATIPGVRLVSERWRVYPGGGTAAHAIGFMGFGTTDALSGQYGLERFYDSALSRSGAGLYANFFAELFTNLSRSSRGRPGADVVTSIEPTVQGFLEEELARYASEWNPASVGGIVMDPKTGSIIALAALPSFDPNAIANADPASFKNPLVENVYEFGSIMKPLTMAAGIDAGVVTPASVYHDAGYAVYDGLKIQNFDGKARGTVPMQEVLNQSLNTGAAYVAVEKLGTAKFREYFDRYGLDAPTGIDLPNEAEPLVANLESPRKIEYATAAYGQGFAVSPVAMARALGTLANHGVVPSPHVARSLDYPGEFGKKADVRTPVRAISPEVADTVTTMLVQVVDKALRGGTVRVPELSIAAKTGTAQIADAATRGYYADRYLHSFFGYFPAYDARFIVFFYAVAPQGAQYASETWTNPFMESVRFLMTYYQIEPDRAPTQQ
jgi:cell division protein FtsI/penicillin-binding protein 2